MAEDIYERLARHLDELPGGFPRSESGVELRILKRLFTPEEAELALHTTLIPEEARVIARRASMEKDEAEKMLQNMVRKGLIFSIEFPDKPAQYMASQYVIGIWEYQVENLDEGLIRDMNEYLPTFVNLETWEKSPQLRTVPVGRSLEAPVQAMPYERAEDLVRNQSKIRVVPCICRREHKMVGEGCDRPEETCLIFGAGAYYYQRRGIGRDIGVEECLEILNQADKAALVLQPNNAKKPTNICCCCGCCCQILLNIKKHPRPAEIVSSPFIASHEPETCEGCGVCVDRCQMEALKMVDEQVELDLDRCIGCGLCVSTCPSGSLKLVRKPEESQPRIPPNTMESNLQLARTRGKLGPLKMARMSLRSKWDRWLARP